MLQRSSTVLRISVALVVVAVAGALAPGAGNAVVKPPEGAGKPTPGSGIGTAAAVDDPRCRETRRYGDYGSWDSTAVGGGPICVKPFDGDDNGGATYQGVSADTIKVVALLPNETQRANPGGAAPINRVDKSRGTYENAVHDGLLAYLPWFETWGRDIEVKFLTSSGSDEAAQRADAVTAKAQKPFAAMHFIVEGLDVFEAEMANAKVLSWGYGTTSDKATEAGALPVGPERCAGRRRQHRRGGGQAARGQEGRVRGERRHQAADPEVRRRVHAEPDRRQGFEGRIGRLQGFGSRSRAPTTAMARRSATRRPRRSKRRCS